MRTALMLLFSAFAAKASVITLDSFKNSSYIATVPYWATPAAFGLYDKLSDTVALDFVAAPSSTLVSLQDMLGHQIWIAPTHTASGTDLIYSASVRAVPGTQYLLSIANTSPVGVTIDLNRELFGVSPTGPSFPSASTPEPHTFMLCLIGLISSYLGKLGFYGRRASNLQILHADSEPQ